MTLKKNMVNDKVNSKFEKIEKLPDILKENRDCYKIVEKEGFIWNVFALE